MLKYNEFIQKEVDNSRDDKNTELYLEGKITLDEWENNFNKINENKINEILKNKIFPVLKKIKEKIKTVGEKGILLLKKIFNFISTFASKKPVLAKLLTIIIIFFVIGIVSLSAATGTDPNIIVPNSEVLNAAIGFVEDLYDSGSIADIMDKMQIQAYLVDLRNDGVIDENWAEDVQHMGNVATKMMDDLKEENPNKFTQLVDFGLEIKDYIFNEVKSEFHSRTNISLTK